MTGLVRWRLVGRCRRFRIRCWRACSGRSFVVFNFFGESYHIVPFQGPARCNPYRLLDRLKRFFEPGREVLVKRVEQGPFRVTPQRAYAFYAGYEPGGAFSGAGRESKEVVF